MAIARMLKVSVVGYANVVDEVTAALQKAGVLQIERHEIEHEAVSEMAVDEQRLHRVERELAEAQFVRDFLGRYHEADVAFGVFISEKFHVSEDDYFSAAPDEEFAALYRETESIAARLATIDRESARLEQLLKDLEPWRGLRLQISQWEGTEHVALFTGVVPLRVEQQVREALREAVEDVTVAEVGHDNFNEAWVVMAYKTALADVKRVLSGTEFMEVTFPELSDYPAEEIAHAEETLSHLALEREGLEERAHQLASHYAEIYTLVETLHSAHDALSVRANYASTERTFIINGWVPAHRRDELEKALAFASSEIDLDFEDPEPGEKVPVELRNRGIVRPFEVLTDLYGRPDYFGFDPTPIMAPFFFLFFGMCLGDVGYGIMLMAGAWAIKRFLDVAPGVKKFMDLLILGGLASAIWGALTRSYMALSVDKLPAFLQYEPLIDPQTELLLLLGVSIGIGVVHVSLGVSLAAYQEFRAGDIVEAISEPVSSLVFIVLTVVAVMSFAGVISPSLGGPVLIAAFAQLLLLKGRILDVVLGRVPAWQIVLVPLKGLLGAYGMVGFGSDFLSYTRLAALGLASLYVGDAMNRLTELSGGIPWVGLLVGALIFVVGHTFNVVINLLGAFVHPTRLQYVEFFGKFYEGGGRNFTPFSPRTKQLVLHPQRADAQKGGPRS